MRKLFTLLMLLGATVIVLGASGQALFAAASNFVFSPGTDDDWTNAANWDQGLPDLATDVGIADSARIGAAASVEANILRVGWSPLAAFNETGLLTVEGDLTVYNSIRLGSDGVGANGTLTIEAGASVDNQSVAANGELWVGAGGGTGELFVSGVLDTVTLDITSPGSGAPTKGIVNILNGGVVNVTDRLTVGFWGGDASLIISKGGSLSMGPASDSFWNEQLPGWVTSGVIQAEPGALLVVTLDDPLILGSPFTLTAVDFFESDFDEDGDVDGADFLAWQVGTEFPGFAFKSEGDANGDGFVDGLDLAIWEGQFGSEAAVVTVATTVPEPTTGVLAIGALAAIFGCRLRHCSRLNI